MKANVAIEITDYQRDKLANLLDGKITKRMVTRADIVALCQQHIGGMIEMAENLVIVKQPAAVAGTAATSEGNLTLNHLARVDPEDEVVLAGKPEGYVIGWNRVKRGV